MKVIHQFLPTISPYDAISNEVFVIQKILQNTGYESEIFSENIHPKFKSVIKNFSKYVKNNSDIIIYHHSIGSDLCNFVLSLKSKIIMIYHNITPAKFFEGINDYISLLCKLGEKQLEELSNKVNLTVVKSEYSKLELEKLGFKKIHVMPILLDESRYTQSKDKKLISNYKNSTNILYVGRISPNKQIEEALRIFYYYQSNINPNAHLFLVGGFEGFATSYFISLKTMTDKVGIKNVHFISDADDKKLISFYSLANIFITMSKHEGFCVPLIESMMFKVPIIANNSSAIPYTLSGAGILIGNETYEEVGELIDMILTDEKMKQQIIEKQSKRLAQIYSKTNETMVEEIIRLVK